MTDGPQGEAAWASLGLPGANRYVMSRPSGSSQSDAPQQSEDEQWLVDCRLGASARAPHPSPSLRPDYAFAVGEESWLQASCFIHGAGLPGTITGF